MEGITVSEIAEKTGLKPKTILTRLRTLGIKPITKEAIYDPSALKAIIEEMRSVGRPKKPKP
jgi:DNA-binding Lrp family transcriptional regulator